MFTRGALKQRNTGFGNGTAVEKTCQRIGRRQKTCALLGLLALLHFYLKVAVTSPAKENKRDVKQQGRHHDLLDASAKPGQAPDHGGHSRTAGPDKHNDCGNDDAACDHISTSGLHVRNIDRKSVVEGKRGSVRVDLGGRSTIKNKKQYTRNHQKK